MSLSSDVIMMYRSGVPIPEIASEVGLREAAVIGYLETSCDEYKRAVACATDESPSEVPSSSSTNTTTKFAAIDPTANPIGLRPSDRTDMLEVIRQIAYEGDNDSTRLKAAGYIIDEAAGRHDIHKTLAANSNGTIGGSPLTLNVMLINQGLSKLRQSRDAAKHPTSITIDASTDRRAIAMPS